MINWNSLRKYRTSKEKLRLCSVCAIVNTDESMKLCTFQNAELKRNFDEMKEKYEEQIRTIKLEMGCSEFENKANEKV